MRPQAYSRYDEDAPELSDAAVYQVRKSSGFSIVEALLAATVFGMIAVGVIGAIVYGRQATAQAGEHSRAAYLAEEGVEATRNIKAAAYSNLVDGTYGLVQSGGIWTLSGSSDTTGIFTRTVQIASGGTDRKTVTVTVTWPQGTTTAQTSSVTRFTNWTATTTPPPVTWTNAIIAGSADATGTTNAIKVATSGNYAYVVRAGTSSNFIVVDISNPASPNIVSTFSLANTPTNIAISGNFAYVTNSTASTGLQIVNISTPSSPSLTRTVSFTGTVAANGVFINGNYAYVVRSNSNTSGSNEFNVVNITTPASASVIGGYNNNIQMNEVYASGNFAYVATSSGTQEMLVINVATPTAPSLAATYNPSGSGAALTVGGYGNTVLLGIGTTLDAINVTTPTSPTRLGTFTAVGTINDIDDDSVNNFAFLGTSSTTGEFQVVNTATPASMSLVKTLDVTGTASTVGGVSYSTTLDIVAGASASDTQELVIFKKN